MYWQSEIMLFQKYKHEEKCAANIRHLGQNRVNRHEYENLYTMEQYTQEKIG